ncbi:MAG: AIDA repeat-containing protein, partial [Victivallales bacterium]|nr:AIDA repeat-containing protein [Victivallales bacterium]
GVASDTVVSRLAEVKVSNGGLAVGTTVNSAGYLRVSQGGVASRTTVNSLGSLLVSNGGLAKDTSVNSDGRVWAYATVSGLTVSSGGSLTLAGGATVLQGRQVYGGTVWANAATQAQGADIVFALDERTPSDEVILYQLNNLSEANSYTVSITAEQASGTYRLATGAGDFSQHVNVTIDGSLSAGGSFWLKPMITPSIPIFVYYNKITNPKHDFGYTYEYRQGHYYTFHLWTDSNDTLLLTVTNRSASDPLPNITTQSLVQLPGTYDFQATITVDNCQRPTYYIRYAKDKDEVAQATYLNGLNFSLTPSDAAKTYYYQIGVLDEYNIFHETVVNPFTVIDYTPPELTVSEVTANYQNGRFSLTWQPATDNVAVQGYEMVINGRVYQLRASALTELNYFGKPDYYYTLDSKLCASIGVANAPVSWSLVAYDAAGNRSEIASGLEGEHALPDLLIDSFSVAVNDQETTSLGLADRATVSILVKNAGQAASPATTARLYCGEVEIATIAVSALEAGESALCQGVMEPYSMSTGRHELRVVVDAQDSVVESDETNNEATLLLQVQDKAKPDLAIAFFYASDTLVQAGQNVSLMVGVENLGKASARASKLYFYAGDKLITSLSLSSLEAGAFRQISYTMPASAIKAGKTVITVVADGLDQVEESNENNNAATLVVSTDLPDLTVSRFRSLSESPTTADDIVLDFIVRNAGAVSADASEAWIYDGDKKLGQVALSALPTNTGAQGSFVIKAGELTAGTHVLTFKADGANTVAETNESNNSKQLTLTVAQKDISAPVISGVTVVQEEDSYQFTIIVNATDNLTDADQLKYQFALAETQDGLDQAATRNGLSFTLEPSDAGKNFWLNVEACDLSGNVGTYVLPFTVNDVTAPVIESFTVTAQHSNAVLAWSASDNVAVV